MKKLKYIISTLLLSATYSFACSPAPNSIEKEPKLSFIGTVKSIEKEKIFFL